MQTFPDHVWRDIDDHVETTYPLEASGAIVRDSAGCFTVLNSPVESATRDRYEVPPRVLIGARAQQQTIHGFYHSHPDGSSEASLEDLEAMHAGCAPSWPGVDWIVVGTRASRVSEVRQFWWDDATSSYRSKKLGS